MSKLTLFLLVISLQVHATTVERIQKIDNNYDLQSNYFAQGVEDGHLKVVVEKVYFPNGCQKTKLEQAFELTEQVVNSQEFKAKVIGYVARYSGRREYTGSNGLSNEQVYEHLMTGRELTMDDTPGEMNLFITKYNSWWSKVIAWTNPRTSKWIHVNWRFYKRFNVDEMVSNIVHEWTHLMGYFHVSRNDSDSVPYAVGRIAGEVAKNILNKVKYSNEENLITHTAVH